MLQNNTTYKIMPLDFVASDTNNNFKINFKIGFISLQKLCKLFNDWCLKL